MLLVTLEKNSHFYQFTSQCVLRQFPSEEAKMLFQSIFENSLCTCNFSLKDALFRIFYLICYWRGHMVKLALYSMQIMQKQDPAFCLQFKNIPIMNTRDKNSDQKIFSLVKIRHLPVCYKCNFCIVKVTKNKSEYVFSMGYGGKEQILKHLILNYETSCLSEMNILSVILYM
jgi:hypothetical protein